MTTSPRVTRYLLVAAVGVIALGLGTLNLFEFYDDLVINGDGLPEAITEAAVGIVISTILLATAYYVSVDIPDGQLRRTALWFGGALLVSAVCAVLVTGSQAIQEEFKSYVVVLDLIALGAVGGVVMGHYDATRRQQRRRIERERSQFVALFENVPTPVIGVKHDGDDVLVEMVNPAFEELFGYTYEELAGRDIREILRPPGETPDPVEEGSLTGIHTDDGRNWQEVQVTLDTEYGHREFVRISAPVDEESVEQEEYAFYIDVSEQIQRKERLQVLSRTLRHDLRNRMNVVIGNAALLEEHVDDEEAELVAEEIVDSAEELMRLGEQTRTVERALSGGTESCPMELSAITEPLVENVRDAYPECTVSVDIPGGMWVQGNDTLPTAIDELLTNAAEHNDHETPEVEITAVETLDGDYVDLCVVDNGPGIDPREYEVLTGERERTQLDHSSGLGLWMVNWIVDTLGGDLEFETNSPRGSIVRLRLPKATPPS